MKTIFPKTVVTFLLTFACFLANAQYTILPFSGAYLESHGLYYKEFESELDGHSWTSNRLPINKEFEFKLVEPRGLQTRDGSYFPGIGVAFLRPNGDTLGYAKNIFGEDTLTGMPDFALKNLSLTLGFNEQSKVGDTVVLHCKFFDQIGSGYLIFNTTLFIVSPDLPLEITTNENSYNTYKGHTSRSSGIAASNVECKVLDTLNSWYAYLHFERVKPLDLKQFKEDGWKLLAYDKVGNSVVISRNDWSPINLKMDNETPNLIDAFQIQANLSSLKFKPKFLRLVYNSGDKTQVLDAVFNAEYTD